MNEWPAAIWASMSAMTAALVLTLIFTLGSFAREAVNIQQVDENAIAIVKEYREYSPYDGTTGLLIPDVITAIGQTRGQPKIWVDINPTDADNFSLVWTNETGNEFFQTSILLYIFSEDDEYKVNYKYGFDVSKDRFDATLVKDLNGAVERIEFRRRQLPNG